MSDDAPRWLTREEQADWMAFSQLLARVPSTLESRLTRATGLGHLEYVLLSGLSMQEGRRMRLKELARFAGASLSRLSNLVTKLERAGWVRREVDPADGRSTFAVLTDAGMETVERTAPHHVEDVRAVVLDPLTRAQLRALGDASRRILLTLDPDAPVRPHD